MDVVEFPPYRLDLEDERLWHGERLLSLRRKPFAILRYLVKNPRRLVTQGELLEHVWGGMAVSDSAIRSHLHELRQVLGEGVIETVIGRGYRFTAPLVESIQAPSSRPRPAKPVRTLVGRGAELGVLRETLDRALAGHRQLCFVTGEPGIGKTTLLDAFTDELDDRGILSVRGQCIEQHGTPEGYLAVIELVGKLLRTESGDQILATFIRYAPTFLSRVPHLLSDDQLAEVSRRAGAGNEAKMVRELLDALEHVSEQQPLVIVIEDVQWSDLATLDVLSLLGQRRERARLMVIATARRSEAQTPAHPLNRVMRSLVARASATALSVERIATSDLQELVDARFPGHGFPGGFIDAIERMTGGTPLFVTTLLDELTTLGLVSQASGRWMLTRTVEELAAHRPQGVRQLIDIQLDRLAMEEQRVLQAGALVGPEFSAALVAAALELPLDQVDERCDDLARRHLFVHREASELGRDGTVWSRYTFQHGLVREVCIERTALAKRQRWQRLVAEELERRHAGHLEEVAHVLAVHFDQAQLHARAIPYYMMAARRTATRLASNDALSAYGRALELVLRTAATPERDQTELQILMVTGQIVIRTSHDPRREATLMFERTVELARKSGDVQTLFAALANLCLRKLTLADYTGAEPAVAELERLAAEHTLPPALLEYGLNARASLATYLGDLPRALAMFQHLAAQPLPDLSTVGPILPSALHGPLLRAAITSAYLGALYWLHGEPSRALIESSRALDLVTIADDLLSLGMVTIGLWRCQFVRRDPLPVLEASTRRVEAATDGGPIIAYEAGLIRAWMRSHERPLTADDARTLVEGYRERVAAFPGGTTIISLPILDMLIRGGHLGLALELVDQRLAFSAATGERMFEPELWMIRGDILISTDRAQAIAEYRRALERARAMGARAFELRNLLRLGRHGGPEDRAQLAALVASWTDPCADLDDARALLEAPAG